MKQLLRSFIPPIFILIKNKIFFNREGHLDTQKMWRGSYASWREAEILTGGYGSQTILDEVEKSTAKVIKGEALFDRDSVTFNSMIFNWPLLSILQKIAIENEDSLSIIDFGGALGSTYYQSKYFLNGLRDVQWSVIEQKNFVDRGRLITKDESLRFYDSIEACLNQDFKTVLFSSVLQYIHDYRGLIENILSIGLDNIIIDRASFINDAMHRITVQKVPPFIYDASYPCRFFNEHEFISIFTKYYRVEAAFKSYCDPDQYVFEDGKKGYWKGFYFKKI